MKRTRTIEACFAAIVTLTFIALTPMHTVAQMMSVPSGAIFSATVQQETTLYRGPGITYAQTTLLEEGTQVTIIERNRVGNWLRVLQVDADGLLQADGWLMTGYLTLNPDLRFSRVPMNETLPDADLSGVESDALAAMYAVPIVSPISDFMHEVYARGQELGNLSDVVTKIGDSVTADPLYLYPMSRGDAVLGPYDYLADTVEFFGESVEIPSVAAAPNFTSFNVFDPFWADGEFCAPNETPLACEFRRKRPSVAFILFGPNDLRYTERSRFREQMGTLMEETMNAGVIPILSTFTYDPTDDDWPEAQAFNRTIVEVAEQYDAPLINLWAAAQALPEYGLDGDSVHMQHDGFRFMKFDTGNETFYGVPLRNLLSLYMLDQLRETLNMQ